MHDHLAELADGQQVVLVLPLSIHREANVAPPVVLIKVRMDHHLRELATENQYFSWDLLDVGASPRALAPPTLRVKIIGVFLELRLLVLLLSLRNRASSIIGTDHCHGGSGDDVCSLLLILILLLLLVDD